MEVVAGMRVARTRAEGDIAQGRAGEGSTRSVWEKFNFHLEPYISPDMQERCEVGERLDKEVCQALNVFLGAHWIRQQIYDSDKARKNQPQEGCTIIMTRSGWNMWYQENFVGNRVGGRFASTNMMKVCSGSAAHQVQFFDMVPKSKSCKTKVKWGTNECMIAGVQVIVAAGKSLRKFVNTGLWPSKFPYVPLGCSIRNRTSGHWDVYFNGGSQGRRRKKVSDIRTQPICADNAIEAPSAAAALVVAERRGGRRLGDSAATAAKAAHSIEGRSAAGARYEGNGTAFLEGNGTALLEGGCNTLARLYCMDAGCTTCSARRRHVGRCRWYSDCVCCFPSCL